MLPALCLIECVLTNRFLIMYILRWFWLLSHHSHNSMHAFLIEVHASFLFPLLFRNPQLVHILFSLVFFPQFFLLQEGNAFACYSRLLNQATVRGCCTTTELVIYPPAHYMSVEMHEQCASSYCEIQQEPGLFAVQMSGLCNVYIMHGLHSPSHCS